MLVVGFAPSKIAAYCSLLQLLGGVPLPSRRARRDRQRIRVIANGAKFAPRNTRSFVSSSPGDWRRALERESGFPTSFSNVA
jgi:hypothetical protein